MPTAVSVFPAPEVSTDYNLYFNLAPSGSEAPLVLVLDGDDQFEVALAAARELEQRQKVEPLSLVGLGYGGGYRSKKNRRGRDYTPTQPAEEPMEAGGAEAFHRVLTRLMPFLYSKIGYKPKHSIVTGHSLSSLFGLFALARPEPLFDRFLISSPSIWWDDRVILKSFQKVAADPIPHPGVRAFLSVGEEDSPSMTGDLELLQTILKERPRAGLKYVVHRFSEKDHYNVLPTAFREGFEWLMKK